MNRAALILPYFGKFPNYFPLFLKSFGFCSDFDLLIFTDDSTPYDYPCNVYVHYTTFIETAARFREKISPEICLHSVHKLCEFKPTYGYVYSEYISGYEYWGYCDCDVIMGDLSRFVLPLFDQKYDKIFALGHLSFIRNSPENNALFFAELNGEAIYKQALFNPPTYWLDESFKQDRKDINSLFAAYGKKVYFQDLSLNPKIETMYFRHLVFDFDSYLYRQISEPLFYVYWCKGRVWKISSQGFRIRKNEFCYLHLQRRKMKYDSSLAAADHLHIVPDSFRNKAQITFPFFWNATSASGVYHYIKYQYAMLIRRIRKLTKNK